MLAYTRKSCRNAACALVFFSAAALGNSHHDLNGTWKLEPTRSNFAGEPVIQTGTVTINDRQHNIYVSRNFSYDGANQSYTYNFSTDGRVNSTIHEGKAFKSKAKWEGDVLVVTTTRSGETVTENYSLNADGSLREIVDRQGHPSITLYFQRQ